LQQKAIEELPLPGTPWYEFLRSGCDFTSKSDEIICGEYHKACENAGITDTNAALRRLIAGTMAFELGFLYDAKKHFLEAVWWMEEAADEELEKKAAFGRGDAKIYKGDAYERAMVHFYLGIIAYQLGEFHDARREFSRAIQADQTKPAEDMRGKFALLHYWLGKTYLSLGDISNARVAMNKAKNSDTTIDESLFNISAIQNSNLTMLIQIGSGPARILKGADWQKADYKPAAFPERACDVYVDGRHAGQATLLADAWRQISTAGISGEQKLQGRKGTAKGVLQVMPLVSLLAVAWDVRGDIRSWSVLPGQILVWNGHLSEGEHTITLKFYDNEDYELKKYRQTWYYIPTHLNGETVTVVRSSANKCDMNGKEF
jgi:tetratricopeptide (TPR) repeat protein